MFENILIPLLLSQILESVKGKTRFQKLGYLIQDEADAAGIEGSSFAYELSHYGPFSAELSSVLDNLLDDGLLKVEIELTPGGYERYVYSLTDKGRRLLKKSEGKNLLSTKLKRIVRDIAEGYGDVPLSVIVDEAYRRFVR